ncbi:DUF169 domain-containing protein [candidate division KSB1 bacterium]
MDLKLKEKFLEKWQKYFGNSELPVTMYYTDKPIDVGFAGQKKWSCIIADIKAVRKGKSLCFHEGIANCGGAKRYLGYVHEFGPQFKYFLSCGIEGELEGERYLKTPELVEEAMKKMPKFKAPAKYAVFKRWDNLDVEDTPEVIIFFAKPDVLSGLFTLVNFDEAEANSVYTPFGSGCGTIITYPYLERDKERPRAVIGMFDVSARPCVEKNVLTFAVPFNRFVQMIDNMDESFLITESWEKVRGRMSK